MYAANCDECLAAAQKFRTKSQRFWHWAWCNLTTWSAVGIFIYLTNLYVTSQDGVAPVDAGFALLLSALLVCLVILTVGARVKYSPKRRSAVLSCSLAGSTHIHLTSPWKSSNGKWCIYCGQDTVEVKPLFFRISLEGGDHPVTVLNSRGHAKEWKIRMINPPQRMEFRDKPDGQMIVWTRYTFTLAYYFDFIEQWNSLWTYMMEHDHWKDALDHFAPGWGAVKKYMSETGAIGRGLTPLSEAFQVMNLIGPETSVSKTDQVRYAAQSTQLLATLRENNSLQYGPHRNTKKPARMRRFGAN